MKNKKISAGIKWLIFFYCLIVFQNMAIFQKVKPNPVFASVFLGTLVYLIIGFIRRRADSRIMAIVFHVIFQILESVAVFQAAGPQVFGETQIPYNLFPIFKLTVYFVFGIITLINVSAVKYLLKKKEYFVSDYMYDQTR